MKVCACFNLRRAARAVTRLFDEVLGRGGLRSTQFVALAAIRAAGTSSLPKLSRALGVDRSTLTRNLQPLVKAGFVAIDTHPPAKTATARLTPKGEAALTRCVPLWREAQDRFEAKVGSPQWNGLLGGLAAISTSAQDA